MERMEAGQASINRLLTNNVEDFWKNGNIRPPVFELKPDSRFRNTHSIGIESDLLHHSVWDR
jgi:hypothetical protein